MEYCNQHFGEIPPAEPSDYDIDTFSHCSFVDLLAEGAQIEAEFTDCEFKNVDWYWCIGHSPIFTNCSFVGCDLRGSFIAARFESCAFEDCKTGDDNLGGKTIWEGSKAISCTLIRTTLPQSVATS